MLYLVIKLIFCIELQDNNNCVEELFLIYISFKTVIVVKYFLHVPIQAILSSST